MIVTSSRRLPASKSVFAGMPDRGAKVPEIILIPTGSRRRQAVRGRRCLGGHLNHRVYTPGMPYLLSAPGLFSSKPVYWYTITRPEWHWLNTILF